MGEVIVVNHLSLDGVMQSPARPDEDERDGFEHGGWGAAAGNDPMIVEKLGVGRPQSQPGALLLGRRTYTDFAEVWPARGDNPFTDALNKQTKYVASNTLSEPLPWVNSVLLTGDAADAVAQLRRGELQLTILGSGQLIGALMQRNLIDRFVLLIHPLVLGSGRRMFADDGPYGRLTLIEAVATTTGVIIATYRAAQTEA